MTSRQNAGAWLMTDERMGERLWTRSIGASDIPESCSGITARRLMSGPRLRAGSLTSVIAEA